VLKLKQILKGQRTKMDMLLVLVGLFFLIAVVVYFKKKDNATFVSKDILELEKELGLENNEVEKELFQ
jgi:hypothetical protein